VDDVVPDGERYEFLIYLAGETLEDRAAVRSMLFPDFSRLCAMRLAKTILSTPSKHLMYTHTP
jgi:hypothetical protein